VAKIATLTDAFTTLDLNLWGAEQSPTIVGGRLRCPATAAAFNDGPGYTGVRSSATWDLTSSEIVVQVATLPDAGNGSIETQLLLTTDEGLEDYSNRLTVVRAGGSVLTEIYVGGNSDYPGQTAAAATGWWRIQHDGENVITGVSADGESWTTLATVDAGDLFPLDAVSVCLLCGYYSTEADPGFTEFDNLNPQPVVHAPAGRMLRGVGR